MGCQWEDRRPAILPVEKRWSFTGAPFVVSSMEAGGNVSINFCENILQVTGFRTADVSKPDSGGFVGMDTRLIISRLYVRHFYGCQSW